LLNLYHGVKNMREEAGESEANKHSSLLNNNAFLYEPIYVQIPNKHYFYFQNSMLKQQIEL